MKNLFVSLVLSLGFGTAFANSTSYNCKLSSLTRVVEITSDAAPCKVVYNGSVKWNAEHEVGYCKKMGENFVEKLKSDGWQCEKAGSTAKAAEAEHAPAAQAPAASETVTAPASAVQEEAPSQPAQSH